MTQFARAWESRARTSVLPAVGTSRHTSDACSRRLYEAALDVLKYLVTNPPHSPNTVVAYTGHTHNRIVPLLSAAKLDRSTPKSQGQGVSHSQYMRRILLLNLRSASPRRTFGKQSVNNRIPVRVRSLVNFTGLCRGCQFDRLSNQECQRDCCAEGVGAACGRGGRPWHAGCAS